MFEKIYGDNKNFITYDKNKKRLLFHHTYKGKTITPNVSNVRLWNSIDSPNIIKIYALSCKRVVKEYFVAYNNPSNITNDDYMEYYFNQVIRTVKKIYSHFSTFPSITDKSILILPNKLIKMKEFISPAYGKDWVSFSENILNVMSLFEDAAKRLNHHSELFDSILKNNLQNLSVLLDEIDNYFYKNDSISFKSDDSFLFPPLFVGRSDEFKFLNKIFNDTIKNGKGATVVIHGGKGVGKTRLTMEFINSKTDVIKVQARASSIEFSTLHSLLESFEPLDKDLLTDGDIKALNNILKMLPSDKASIERVSDINKITFEVSKFLRKLLHEKPIMVAIDDFDEMDSKSLMVLNNLAKAVVEFPIMLIINSEYKNTSFKVVSKNIHFKELKELKNDYVEILLQSLLGENDFVEPNFVKWITLVSGNVPLNTIEVVKYLANSYQIFFKNGKWTTQKENPEEFNVPKKLNDMILSSYSSLNESEREILNYIVCDSEGFTVNDLQHISSIQLKDLTNLLKSLQDKNFVISNEKRWVCSSANMRNSLYSKIEDKKRYHRKILSYLEKNGYLSMRIVDHYIKADMPNRAAETLFAYARKLFFLGKSDYAADAIEALIVLYNRIGRSIKNIKTYAMRIFNRAGRYQEMITTYGIGSDNDVFAHLYKLRALVHLNKSKEAVDFGLWLESSIDEYDDLTKFKILNELAYVYYRLGNLEKSLQYIKKMDKVDKNGFSRFSYIEFYKIKAIVYSAIGYKNKKYFNLSVDLYKIVLQLSKIENDLINEAIVYNNLGSMYMYDNNNLAKQYLSKSATLFSEAGNIYLKSYPMSNLAMIHLVSGQVSRGMRTINDLLRMAKNFGWKYDYVEYLKIKAQMYFFVEDISKFYDVLKQIEKSVSSEEESLIVKGQILLARLLLQKDKIEDFQDEIQEYFSRYDDMKHNPFYMVWYYYLKALSFEDRSKGVKYLKKILQYKDSLENFPFQIYHDIASSYVRANQYDKAQEYALKLFKISSEGGAKLFEAKANVLLGVLEAKIGVKKDAFIKLYNAKSMFKFMGIGNLVAYCDENIEQYELSPSTVIKANGSSKRIARTAYERSLKESEDMIHSLMNDIYMLKTFLSTVFSLAKEIEMNSFAALVVDQILGLFNVYLAAFFVVDDDFEQELLFAKDYQENIYKNLSISKSIISKDPLSIKIDSKNGYVYIPITYENELKAFLYLQTQEAEYKISNFEKELLMMLPDSLSMIFQHTHLYMMAILDPLTKLYTRNYFINKMNDDFNDAKTFGLEYTVMMLDIDDFKKFNDTYGHSVGDDVLREIAKRIKKVVGELGMVGRFGGEEFTITLPIGYISSSKIANKINEEVRKISIPGVDRKISVSIGIASYPHTNSKDYLELLDKADMALYITKSSGKDSFTVFEENLVHNE